MKTAADKLEELTQSYERKQKELENEFKKQQEDLVENLKADFVDFTDKLLKSFQSIPAESRQDVLNATAGRFSNAGLELVALVGGKRSKSAKATTKTQTLRKTRISDAAILEFLNSEKPSAEVARYFTLSAVTVSKRLNKLLEARQVTERTDEKRVKFWKKV